MEKLHRVNARCCFAVGAPLNALLLLLIAKRTSEELRPYSLILAQTALLDLAFLLINLLHHQVYNVRGSNLLVYAVGPLVREANAPGITTPADRYWNWAFYELWTFILVLSTLSLSMQFYYRYLVLCRGREMTLRTYLLRMTAGPVVAAMGLTALSAHDGWVDDGVIELARRTFTAEEVRYMVTYAPGGENPAFMLLATTVGLLFTLANYGTVVYCSVRVWQHIKRSMPNLSADSVVRQANRQLNRVLLAQAVIPIMITTLPSICIELNLSPVAASSSSSTSPISTEAVVSLMSMCLNWLSVVNAAITLFIIKPYRMAIINAIILRPICGQRSNGNTLVVHFQQTTTI